MTRVSTRLGHLAWFERRLDLFERRAGDDLATASELMRRLAEDLDAVDRRLERVARESQPSPPATG